MLNPIESEIAPVLAEAAVSLDHFPVDFQRLDVASCAVGIASIPGHVLDTDDALLSDRLLDHGPNMGSGRIHIAPLSRGLELPGHVGEKVAGAVRPPEEFMYWG